MHEINLRREVYDDITDVCLGIYEQGEMLPVDEVLMRMMDLPGVPMHYPYHHYILPAAFLTLAAIADKSSKETLEGWLSAAKRKGKTVPGGFCGDCGACGGGIGIGIFLSTYTGTTSKSRESWAMVNEGTGRALMHVASYPGPRCCKRVLFLGAQEGVRFASEKLNLDIPINEDITCHYYPQNPDCLGVECPFFK